MIYCTKTQLSLLANNVVSIDISHFDENTIVCKVADIIQNYLNACEN